MEEVSILKTLSHENILDIHGAYQSKYDVIVVTEFLSGGELFEKVASDDYHLTEAECIRFMYQICDAVSYLHRKVCFFPWCGFFPNFYENLFKSIFINFLGKT